MTEENELPKKSRTKEGIPLLVSIKFLFLTGVIFFGILALYRLSFPQKNTITRGSSQTLRAVKKIKTSLAALDRNSIQRVASASALQKSSQYVLGEVTHFTDGAIEAGVEKSTDYIYEHTIEQVITALLSRLPERQQELIRGRMCEE